MAIYQIDAGPGSGKTTTAVCAGGIVLGNTSIPSNATNEQLTIYKTLKSELPSTKSIAYFAHTTTIRDELKKRLITGTPIFTLHGAGQSQLIKMFGFQQLNKNRTDKFIETITGQSIYRLPYKESRNWVACKAICKLLKQEYLDPTDHNLLYLKEKYPDLCLQSIPSDWAARCEDLLRRSLFPNRTVEFDDMVWMAAKYIKRPVYDLGIVDESQDLSSCMYEFLIRLCKNLLFCGDPNQAIGAFMGADEAMFQRIIDTSDAVFPLKTTFRCPPNIITKANRLIANSVLPGPNKIPGREENIGYQKYCEKLAGLSPITSEGKLNTLTMCRTNAPLITLALLLVNKGIPCKLADKDLAAKLIYRLKTFKIKEISQLSKALDSYVQGIAYKNNPMLLLMAEDFAEAIRQLSAGCSSLTELEAKIKKICTPNNKDAHLLSTIHKAKGLEAPVTFILNPPVEHPLANQNKVHMKQEKHVHFVGLTRTKQDLYWVCN